MIFSGVVMNKDSKSEGKAPLGTVVELFAGVGGFRLGLEASGWSTIFSNQWEPSTKTQHASACYQFRFKTGTHTNSDIAELVADQVKGTGAIPDSDLIVGGFPCQDYSVAKGKNNAAGLIGKKGVLWWEIHKLISLNRPKFVFLENVDRLLKSPAAQPGRDFAIMLSTLGSLGYLIEWRVVNAAEAGFPQRRIRTFIVGSRLDITPDSIPDSQDYIGQSGILGKSFPAQVISDVESFPITQSPHELTEFFNIEHKSTPFENAGYFFRGTVFTAKTRLKGPIIKPKTLGDILLPDESIGAEFFIRPEELEAWEFQKGAKKIERIHKESGQTYTYAEGKMSFPDKLESPSRTILTGEGGSSPSRFRHIIFRNGRYRRLTPIELERLNGFPDDWTKYGLGLGEMSNSRRAFFMGNALVVGLVERVGQVLYERLLSPNSPKV
jgi:DNA (cytosine-5)-methyltransferase 1